MATATNRTLDDFRSLFPVRKAFRTGRWGWRRVGDCLNLNACRFETEEAAAADRDGNYQQWLRYPEDF
jgi:hypothetical protein